MSKHKHPFTIPLSIFLTVVIYFGPKNAQALILQCSSLLLNEVKTVHTSQWVPYNQYELFDYRDFKKILFLSDAGKGGRALKYSAQDDQMIISSDFGLSSGVNILLDNNHLPFRNDSFDLILMSRGLCPCKGTIACGGIDTQYAPMKRFLVSTIHILNKKNPNSLALFTGFYYPDLYSETIPKLWIKIIQEVNLQYPYLQIAIISSENMKHRTHQGFIGIAISTDMQTPVSTRLRELSPDLVNYKN